MNKPTVLVTGGNGYLGSILITELCFRGYHPIIIDNGLTSKKIPQADDKDMTIIPGDIGSSDTFSSLLPTCQAVVHLAAIVGDPAGQLDPDLTWTTNYLGTIHLAEACRRAGIRRFLFASTCSVYGVQGDRASECSPLSPRSLYAQTKQQAEQYLLSRQDASFALCIFRLATLYGCSARMRFDLSVNSMTAQVYGGAQIRPFLHVHDAARLFLAALEHPVSPGQPEIYNCATEHLSLSALGHLIAQEVPDTRCIVLADQIDQRSYAVDCTRMFRVFPSCCSSSLREGIRAIRGAIQSNQYHDRFASHYHNDQLVNEYLLRRQELSRNGASLLKKEGVS
jgi:nucleoside-diphosphate-sugar epimerase